MGLFDDIINGINALANFKKADAEQIKAKTQKDKMKNLKKENKVLKKALSKNTKIGIIGIVVSIAGISITVFFIYFPIIICLLSVANPVIKHSIFLRPKPITNFNYLKVSHGAYDIDFHNLP